MQLTQAQLEFNKNYSIIRKRIVFGRKLDLKAIHTWIIEKGRLAANGAEKEAADYYSKHQVQFRRQSKFEIELMKEMKEDSDE